MAGGISDETGAEKAGRVSTIRWRTAIGNPRFGGSRDLGVKDLRGDY